MESDIFKNKNAAAILISLLEGDKKMSHLQEVVKNYSTLKLTVIELEKAGYVKTDERIEGRKVIYVSLTEKGRSVALKLKEAEDIATGKVDVVMTPDWKERFRYMKAMLHYNEYGNVIRIGDYYPDGTARYVDVEININGNKMYLYCNLCKSFNCEHINFIWSHPQLRRDLLEKAREKHLVIVEPEDAEKENGH